MLIVPLMKMSSLLILLIVFGILSYPNIHMALLTKTSQLGHNETIRTNGNVHWERSLRVNFREIAIIDKV